MKRKQPQPAWPAMGRTGTLSEPGVVCLRTQTGLCVFFAYHSLLAVCTGYLLDLETAEVGQAKAEAVFPQLETRAHLLPRAGRWRPRSPAQPITGQSIATPPACRLDTDLLLPVGTLRAGLRASPCPFCPRIGGREAGENVAEDRKVHAPAKGETKKPVPLTGP